MQILYAIREYAASAVDILGRRTRLAFLNVRAAEEALPRVIEIMSKELGWSKQKEKVLNYTDCCTSEFFNVSLHGQFFSLFLDMLGFHEISSVVL